MEEIKGEERRREEKRYCSVLYIILCYSVRERVESG